MTPVWAQRQEELLRGCIVSPDVFTQMLVVYPLSFDMFG